MQLRCVTIFLFFAVTSVFASQFEATEFDNDDSITHNIFSTLYSMFRKDDFNLTSLVNSIRPSACVRNCMPDLADTMSVSLKNAEVKSASLFLKDVWKGLSTSQICQKIDETNKCLDNAGKCSDNLIEMIGRTFKYLCLDNRSILDDTLPCIRDQAVIVSHQCENACRVTESMRSVIDENTTAFRSSDVTAAVVKDMVGVCNSSMCYIGCLQKRIDEKCKGKTELLVDMIFKTIASGSEDGKSLNAFGEILSNALPAQCRYLLQEQKSKVFQTALKKASPWLLHEPVNRPSSVGSVDSSAKQSAPRGLLPTAIPIYLNNHKFTLSCNLLDENDRPFDMPDFKSLAQLLQKQYLSEQRDDEIEDEDEDAEKLLRFTFFDNPSYYNDTTNNSAIVITPLIPIAVTAMGVVLF